MLKVLLLNVGLLLTGPLLAQSITVSGTLANPLTVQASDLMAMPRTDVTATDHGSEHRYSGVALVDLLRKAGTTLGGELRGKNLTKVVVIKAADGYEAVFALAELDPEFSPRTILLADRIDGTPLPDGVGPFRVVVPGERKQGRWVRQVTAIDVRQVGAAK